MKIRYRLELKFVRYGPSCYEIAPLEPVNPIDAMKKFEQLADIDYENSTYSSLMSELSYFTKEELPKLGSIKLIRVPNARLLIVSEHTPESAESIADQFIEITGLKTRQVPQKLIDMYLALYVQRNLEIHKKLTQPDDLPEDNNS